MTRFWQCIRGDARSPEHNVLTRYGSLEDDSFATCSQGFGDSVKDLVMQTTKSRMPLHVKATAMFVRPTCQREDYLVALHGVWFCVEAGEPTQGILGVEPGASYQILRIPTKQQPTQVGGSLVLNRGHPTKSYRILPKSSPASPGGKPSVPIRNRKSQKSGPPVQGSKATLTRRRPRSADP